MPTNRDDDYSPAAMDLDQAGELSLAAEAAEAMVTVQLPAADVEFLRGFDPDRDRTATRADMARVIEHLAAALDYTPDSEP